jgi:hypothetical protein
MFLFFFSFWLNHSFSSELEFKKVCQNTLFFQQNTETFQVTLPLFEITYLGDLRSEWSPFFLFQAKSCQKSDSDKADCPFKLHVIKPHLKNPLLTKDDSFTYPGKVYHQKKRHLLHESLGFFGNCLNDRSKAHYVVFEKEKVDRKRRPSLSILVVEPGEDHLIESSFSSHFQQHLTNVRTNVRKKKCFEIQGINRNIL